MRGSGRLREAQNTQGSAFRVGASAFVFWLVLGVFPPQVSATPLTDRMGLTVFSSMEKAPDLAAPDLSGRILRLSDFRGKVVLLNFWATWCVPCRKEIPSLVRLEKAFPKGALAVVSVAMDRRLAHIVVFARKYAIPYPVMEGRKGRVDSRYYGMGLPQTYVLDRKGNLLARAIGGRDWADADSLAYFRMLIRKPASAGAASLGKD